MRWTLAEIELTTLGLVEQLDLALNGQVSVSLRRSYGHEAEKALSNAVRHVTLANTRPRLKDRIPLINDYLDDLEVLEAFLRCLHQPNNCGISTRKKCVLDMVIDDLDRQARAWKKDTLARIKEGQTEAMSGGDSLGRSRPGNGENDNPNAGRVSPPDD